MFNKVLLKNCNDRNTRVCLEQENNHSWLSENVKNVKDVIKNANGKRGGINTLVGGDQDDEAKMKQRQAFLLRALNGNGDGDQFVLEWTEEKSYVLPSWFSFAASLICARDRLVAMIDNDKGVIPESEDRNIAGLVPYMMLISGPPMRPGQIYSARRPGSGVTPSKKENYIQMSHSFRDAGNGTQEKVYLFHADTSLFKVKKYSRHKAIFTCNFFPIFYHYFDVVLPRLEEQAKKLPGYDTRLDGYAFINPRTLKPYRKVAVDGNVTHSGDASSQILKSLEYGLDAVVGVGTYKKYRLDRFNRMYETRVLTFGVNTTPGTLLSIVDKAICAGFIPKDQVIINKEMIDVTAKQMEALGISNCQAHYTFMNGDTHSEHAITIYGALQMVEKMIADNPLQHMDLVEKLRAQRRTHASNKAMFCARPGSQITTSSTNVKEPAIVSPSPTLISPVDDLLVEGTPTDSFGSNSLDTAEHGQNNAASLDIL